MTAENSDLFGNPIFGNIPDRALTPRERRLLRGRKSSVPSGHAHTPGTGPAGETCGSCLSLVRKRMGKTYLKCGKNRAGWTGGGKSDVRARDAACNKWEARPADTAPPTEHYRS